ncbi:MAG: helix-turn-helix domain-containing protein [Lachnospiraceae bacterium]|nr:helix-turn-helix domain-containing protein [Lachnospiraceae bacterium]
MKAKSSKKYLASGGPVECHIKTIDAPFDYSDDMHNHGSNEILIILGGEISIYTESAGRILRRGDVCLMPRYVFHRADIITRDKYDRIVINIDDEVLSEASIQGMDLLTCFEPMAKKSLRIVHLNDDELEEIHGYAKGLEKNLASSYPGSEILADSFLKIIMVKLTAKYESNPVERHPNIMPPMVRKTFEYIDKHLTEEIALADLEKEIHHNGTYISRSVKKISGLSIRRYIIAKRVALACHLLREGLSPSDACFMSGFNNYSNFSRTFAKEMGKSPKQFQLGR